LPDSPVVTRFCPSCDKGWPDGAAICRECLVELVDDPDATVRCRHCGREWPAHMHSCPNCLAELRSDPEAVAEALGDILAAGGHLFRPDGVPPFASGPACTLGRLSARGGLVLTNADGLVEASVDGADVGAVPPLACRDLDGSTLFRLVRYEASAGAVVAVASDGAALGTYLLDDRLIEVRDGTSAPVARLEPVGHSGEWALVETGGPELATVRSFDQERDGWVDDQWSLRRVGPRLPLRPLAAVGLVVAAKVLLGRPWPVGVGRDRPDADGDEPLWNRWGPWA
jgi:hypothetical protein